MTEETRNATIGDIVVWEKDGELLRGEVTEQKGSWSTVATDDGERKVRTKKLEIWDAPEGEDDEAPRTMSKTLAEHKPRYVPTTTHSGKKSLNNGDAIANILASAEPTEVAMFVGGLLDLDLVEKYAGLNPGQVRMNSGNRLRGIVKRGDMTTDEVAEAWAKWAPPMAEEAEAA